LKWVKYLPEFGWQPIVLSARPHRADVVDPDLCEEIPVSAIVSRTDHVHPKRIEQLLRQVWTLFWRARLRFIARHIEPYKVIRWWVPDVYFCWLVPALREGWRLVQRYEPDVLLSTAPPYTAHLIGLWLSRITGVPFVADYRDPWSSNPFATFPSPAHRILSRWLDRAAMRAADMVTTTTERMTDELRELGGNTEPEKFHTIWNGFDRPDFLPRQSHNRGAQLVISHIGSLYGLRQADGFLSVVDALVTSGRIEADHLRVSFVGTGDAGTGRYEGRPWVERVEHVCHGEAIRRMCEADYLVLLVPSQSLSQVPGKLFEYLAAERPIIAIAPPDSSAAHIVKCARAGVVISPDEAGSLSSLLLSIYVSWQNEAEAIGSDFDRDRVNFFERRRQTEELANLLSAKVSA
jgi:hypothetical protein